MPRRRRRTLVWALVVLTAIAVVCGIAADRFVRLRVDPSVRAGWLVWSGRRFVAEGVFWQALQRGPVTTSLVLSFLENHAMISEPEAHRHHEPSPHDDEVGPTLQKAPAPQESPISDDEIERFLLRDDLPKDASLLGLYWHATTMDLALVEPFRKLVEEAADDEPPMPWANHLLAVEALRAGDEPRAIERFLREGKSIEGHGRDLDAAFAVMIERRDWRAITEQMNDPRVAANVGAYSKFRWALQVHELRRALRWSLPASYQMPTLGPLVLAVIAALAWLAFCARLGRIADRPEFRVPIYLSALVLGALSIYPTTILIAVQESAFHLMPTGNAGRDVVFYVLGVGLREELSKVLLFAPLLFFLRKRGTRMDVLVCGALVGLGFALVENLEYFSRGSLSSAIARFLTANFFHMAMTGLTALALDAFVREPEQKSFESSRTFLLVVLMHGAYDFFLSGEVGQHTGYLAMVTFFVVTRWFLVAASQARAPGERVRLLNVFAIGVAIVTGATFVYASALAGPLHAGSVMLEGLFGLAIVVAIFVRQLIQLENS